MWRGRIYLSTKRGMMDLFEIFSRPIKVTRWNPFLKGREWNSPMVMEFSRSEEVVDNVIWGFVVFEFVIFFSNFRGS